MIEANQNPLSNVALLEATFRHMFTDNASGGQSAVAAFCISVGKSGQEMAVNPILDPSPELLSRLADVRPNVLPGSGCAWTDVAIVEKKSRKHALLFAITEILCSSASKCEVKGGYLEGNLSSSGNTYVVERNKDVWKVTGNTMHWIS